MIIKTARKIKGFETLEFDEFDDFIGVKIITKDSTYKKSFDKNTLELTIKDWIEEILKGVENNG